MKRIPLLTGSRIAVAEAPEDAVILRPPAPGEPCRLMTGTPSESAFDPLTRKPTTEK